MARALVNVPATAKRGEIVEIKALAQHNMETGYRRTRAPPIITARSQPQNQCGSIRAEEGAPCRQSFRDNQQPTAHQ